MYKCTKLHYDHIKHHKIFHMESNWICITLKVKKVSACCDKWLKPGDNAAQTVMMQERGRVKDATWFQIKTAD